METIKNIINWIVSNWQFITGAVIPAIILLFSTLRAKSKIAQVKTDAEKWKKIGQFGLQWVEMKLAMEPKETRGAAIDELKNVQNKIGIQQAVDEELTAIRAERKQRANDGLISLDANIEMDGKGRLTPGIGIKFEKLF